MSESDTTLFVQEKNVSVGVGIVAPYPTKFYNFEVRFRGGGDVGDF